MSSSGQVQHTWQGDVSYTSKDCRDLQLCNGNSQGEHYAHRCMTHHQGLEDGEACKAVLVVCSVHRNKVYRDVEQEDKILSAR